MDNSLYFVHLLRAGSKVSSCSRDCFLSFVIFASIEIMSRCMPKKVSDVIGPSTLDGLMGVLSA